MENASSVLKNSEGERASEAKNKSESLHLHCPQQLVFITNLIVLPFLFFLQLNLLEDALLSLENGLHRAKVLLVDFSLSKDVLVECVCDKAVSESALVVVEGRIDDGSIDEDKFARIFVSIEDGRFVLYFFGKVTIVDIQLFHSFPVVVAALLLFFGKLMERHLDDIDLCLHNRVFYLLLDLVVLCLLNFGLDLFGALLIVEPIGLEDRNQLGVKLLGKQTEIEDVDWLQIGC